MATQEWSRSVLNGQRMTGRAQIAQRARLLARGNWWTWIRQTGDLLQLAQQVTGTLDAFARVAARAFRTTAPRVSSESCGTVHAARRSWAIGRFAVGRALHLLGIVGSSAGDLEAVLIDTPAFGAVDFVGALHWLKGTGSGALWYANTSNASGGFGFKTQRFGTTRLGMAKVLAGGKRS